MRTEWAWFSARDLLWLTLLVLASGILLLVPLFVGAQRVPTTVVELFRALHAASSVLLLVGALGHAIMRAVRAAMSHRAITSGVLASTVVGLGVVTGSMASVPRWWADQLAMDAAELENWSSVFHFGYSAAILLALVFWHVRSSRASLLPPPQRSTIALGVVAVVAMVATASSDVPTTLTRLIAPAFAFWAWWTVLLPQLLWAAALRTTQKSTEPRP